MLEVELKFALADAAGFRRRLEEAGARAGVAVQQHDAYFNHPARDFAATDEALRVRTVGGASRITYKGPKPGGAAKTRFELELPLADATADGWRDLLRRLGFGAVAEVRKRRTPFALAWRGRRFELSIDEVDGLGVFAEVETLAADAARDEAAGDVAALAAALGLADPEPLSYLELLLAKGA